MAGCKQSQNDLATEAATGDRDKGQRDAKTAGLVRVAQTLSAPVVDCR